MIALAIVVISLLGCIIYYVYRRLTRIDQVVVKTPQEAKTLIYGQPSTRVYFSKPAETARIETTASNRLNAGKVPNFHFTPIHHV